MAQTDKIEVIIRRQESSKAESRYETFAVDNQPGLNVISILQSIAADPRTIDGRQTTPVAWECSCLEEVCGACTMVINGRVRQACAALVEKIPERPIRIEPMKTFSVVRDLIVDRKKMFEALKAVKAWVPIDGTHDLGAGPRYSARVQEIRYRLSECMTCGCCAEACPQYNDATGFLGPAAVAQVQLFNCHPTGAFTQSERLDAMMGPGGLHNCGNAQACVEVCPKNIPLTDAIAEVGRQLTVHSVKRLLGFS